MKKILLLSSFVMGMSLLSSQSAFSHCEIPCGIYGDKMRVDMIEENIRTGIYKPSQKLPTNRELMAVHSVSQSTVTRTIMEMEKAGLVYIEKGRGVFVAPAEMRSRTALHLGMMVSSLEISFNIQMVQGAEEVARSFDRPITLYNCADKGLDYYGFLSKPLPETIAGLLLSPEMPLDELNRLINKSYPDTTNVSYEYDANGNTVTVENTGGQGETTYMEYDGLGRMTRYEVDYGPFSKNIAYGYDENGNKVSMKGTEGDVTTYEYDENDNT